VSAIYRELLLATIEHLERLKAAGTRFVSLDESILAALSRNPQLERLAPVGPAPRGASPSRPSDGASVSRQTPAAPTLFAESPAAPAVLESDQSLPASASPALSPEAKAAAMSELRERALVCVKCPHLARSRRNVVFGVGDINSPLMFIGEAPGVDEDLQGEPFVGKAGQLLTRIIQTMGLSRDQVYIANVLKCRPDTPGQTAGNRKPTTEEMNTCLPYLNAQIDIIRPEAIVALGGTAVEGLLGKAVGITKLRGHWQNFRGIPLMPTYHPSYLLRNQALSVKREVWDDMLQVMERLGMSISEKQRGFFLKA